MDTLKVIIAMVLFIVAKSYLDFLRCTARQGSESLSVWYMSALIFVACMVSAVWLVIWGTGWWAVLWIPVEMVVAVNWVAWVRRTSKA